MFNDFILNQQGQGSVFEAYLQADGTVSSSRDTIFIAVAVG